jgi:hypothetical protein
MTVEMVEMRMADPEHCATMLSHTENPLGTVFAESAKTVPSGLFNRGQ